MLHARRIVLQPHPDAVRLLHHVPVGDDITFRIDNHARTQRTLANRAVATLAALPAKESG